jgi:hypothetical protein
MNPIWIASLGCLFQTVLPCAFNIVGSGLPCGRRHGNLSMLKICLAKALYVDCQVQCLTLADKMNGWLCSASTLWTPSSPLTAVLWLTHSFYQAFAMWGNSANPLEKSSSEFILFATYAEFIAIVTILMSESAIQDLARLMLRQKSSWNCTENFSLVGYTKWVRL